MLFTSHFKKLLFFFISIIIGIEIIVRIFPVYKWEESEKFLIYSTRLLIESGNNQFNILILGDSTSMSLNPGPYKDVFNFSLPAMGVRYYPYLIKKYLQYGNQKPLAIIFSGSIDLVRTGKGVSLVSPELMPYTYPDIPLSEYLYNRTIRRIHNIFRGSYDNEKKLQILRQVHQEWSIYAHRYLTLFSAREIFDQYRGPEWFYIMAQSIPLLYQTYMFRDAIENLFKIHNYQRYKNLYGTPYCTCERIFLPECQPPKSRPQDNEIIYQYRIQNNGFYNISDRLSPKLAFAYQMQKEKTIQRLKKHASLNPNLDFSYTREFIEFLQKNNILYIYLAMPYPEYYKGGKYLKVFYQHFEPFLKQFPNTKMFYFPTRYFDPDLYADQVHLTCKGAEILNKEFIGIVLPKIRNYIYQHSLKKPYNQNSR